MPFVIGTAGHIDHGKTSLVKALTGEDTDRLKEEKARGISIELGFAHLDLPDGKRAGVVDVPGHERFIRTMLAGAHGIDLVLFTVAADDGVMPQTEEHFDIVHLLGIQHAIFVLTKADLASAARLAEVAGDIEMLTAATPLEGSSVVPVSVVTGQGLDALRAEIASSLGIINKPAPPGYFRLPVDRVFMLQGHGLIVTGTALSGAVVAGDRLRAVPGNQSFRVRTVQVHSEQVERATWGQRVALNLTGPDAPLLERGHVLCDERLPSGSERFDARVEVRGTGAPEIKQHQRVRVHLGTAERLGKLVFLDGRPRLGPKQTAFAQIVMKRPLLALRGDRFVIRDETANRTLGGGSVLHPFPPVQRRKQAGLQEKLELLASGGLDAVTGLYIDDHHDFAVPLMAVAQFVNRTLEETEAAVAGAGIRELDLDGERLFTTERKWQALGDTLADSLRAFHAEQPLLPGQEMEEVRAKLPWEVPAKIYRACVSQLVADGKVARDGNVLRLPEHRVALGGAERKLADGVEKLLKERSLTPPDLRELETHLGARREALLKVLRVLDQAGAITRVSADLYYSRESLTNLKQTMRDELTAKDAVTPASFRDRFGITRKYAIPLLEHLDREGVTIRIGDVRRLHTPKAAGN